jgi:hypothetical protein
LGKLNSLPYLNFQAAAEPFLRWFALLGVTGDWRAGGGCGWPHPAGSAIFSDGPCLGPERKLAMKQLFALLWFLLALPALAQEPGGVLTEERSKNLFRTAAASHPGIKIRLELQRRGRRQFVPLATVFYAGDRVKLHFEANFPAYVEIYNRGSDGRLEKLFPYAGLPARVKVTTPYVVPVSATDWFEFDNTPGTERLAFIFSAVEPRRVASITKPKPASRPRPPAAPGTSETATGGTVTVNEDDEAGGKSLEVLHDEALEEGKNLKRVQARDEHYVFGTKERLQRSVGVVVALQHR